MSTTTNNLPVGADLIADRSPIKPRTDKYHPKGYTSACVYIQGTGVTHWGRCIDEISQDLFGFTVVSNSRYERGYGTFTRNGNGIFYGAVRGPWSFGEAICNELCQGENEHELWDPCPRVTLVLADLCTTLCGDDGHAQFTFCPNKARGLELACEDNCPRDKYWGTTDHDMYARCPEVSGLIKRVCSAVCQGDAEHSGTNDCPHTQQIVWDLCGALCQGYGAHPGKNCPFNLGYNCF